MEYKILSVTKEKCIDGITYLEAEAQDDKKTIVNISYRDNGLVSLNNHSIKIILDNEYGKIALTQNKYTPKVGDIL